MLPPHLRSQPVLVTGAAGLVGRSLIQQLLHAGYPVRALVHQTPLADISHPALDIVQGDILNTTAMREVMEGIAGVYHTAALVSFNPKHRRALYRINTEGTANIVNAALDAGVQKLVYVSSVAALGRLREGRPVTETDRWTKATSNSIYGHSKHLAEMEVWRAMGEGLPAVIVNPVIILGAGNWNEGSSAIFKSIYNRFPWYSRGTSGFVDVRDVAAVMIRLMESSVTGERFIVSAENQSYADVFRQIATAFQVPPPHREVTPLLAALVWRWEAIKARFTGGNPLITRESATTALARVQYNNQKLLDALPNFSYRPLQQTIEDACRYYLQQVQK